MIGLYYLLTLLPTLDLYTVDVHLDNIVSKKAGKDKFDNENLSTAIKKKRRVIDRLKRNKLREAIIADTENACDQFDKDRELVAMREFFTKVTISKINRRETQITFIIY